MLRGVNVSAVSCSSDVGCTAVGGRGALRWNGAQWLVQHTAGPRGSRRWLLNAVSCPTAMTCFAVGSRPQGQQGSLPLAERWDGSDWHITPVPNPGGQSVSGQLDAVSCTSASACTAVGGQTLGGSAIAERWNGSRWSTQQTPAAAEALTGVSCTSARLCTAVGYDVTTGNPAVVRWAGAGWSLSQPAGSAFLGGGFGGVSCPTARACTMVGLLNPGSGPPAPLVARWNSGRWSGREFPFGYSLSSVSCPSARQCTAVGDAGVAVEWDGTRWLQEHTPDNGYLDGVSCTSVSFCIAVGNAGGDAVAEQRS